MTAQNKDCKRCKFSYNHLTEDKSDDFAKIKILEAVDMIRDDIRTTFEDEFVGKVENSYDNKIVFIAAVNKYFKDLAKPRSAL